MPIRETDDPIIGARLKREVPLWGVLCLLGFVAVQAVGTWGQVSEQGKTLSRMETAQSTWQTQIAQQLAEINRSLNTSNLKDLEHDFKIKALEDRVTKIETNSTVTAGSNKR